MRFNLKDFFAPFMVMLVTLIGLVVYTHQVREEQRIKNISAQEVLTEELTDTSDISTSIDIVVNKDISFGPFPEQKLDFCRPKVILGKYPAMILIHGAGRDKTDYTQTCKNLARKGYIATSINYRQDPPGYPKTVQDAKLALSWLKDRSDVNTFKVGALGSSAGGWLSSLLGTQEFVNKVKCVIVQFGPSDFTDPNLFSMSYWQVTGFPLLFGDVSYKENPRLYKKASVISYVSQSDAKFIYLRSVNDSIIPKSQPDRLIEAFNKVDIDVPYYEFNGTGPGHATKLDPLERKRVHEIQMNFLNSCLK